MRYSLETARSSERGRRAEVCTQLSDGKTEKQQRNKQLTPNAHQGTNTNAQIDRWTEKTNTHNTHIYRELRNKENCTTL